MVCECKGLTSLSLPSYTVHRTQGVKVVCESMGLTSLSLPSYTVLELKGLKWFLSVNGERH